MRTLKEVVASKPLRTDLREVTLSPPSLANRKEVHIPLKSPKSPTAEVGELARHLATLSNGKDEVTAEAVAKELSSKRPRGFLNKKNNCFLSATLQALFACPPMMHCCLQIAALCGDPSAHLADVGEKKMKALLTLSLIVPELFTPSRRFKEQKKVDEPKQDEPRVNSTPSMLKEEKLFVELKDAHIEDEEDESSWNLVAKKDKPKKKSKGKSKHKNQLRGSLSSTNVVLEPSGSRSVSVRSTSSSVSSESIIFDSIYGIHVEYLLESFWKSCGEGAASQEDAQEFLQYLLDRIQSELVEVSKSAGLRLNAGEFKIGKEMQDDDGWEEVGTGNKTRVVREEPVLDRTVISDIFGGNMSILLRKQGSKDAVSYQPFFSLPLPVEDEYTNAPLGTLEEALEAFKAPSEIEGVKSSKSSRIVKASRMSSVSDFGKCLIFHLKRFTYFDRRAVKLNHYVSYPMEFSMEIGKAASSQIVSLRLRAVVVHHGNSPRKGHYTAFCKFYDDCWYHCDDVSVVRVDPDVVLKQFAYLIFYERI